MSANAALIELEVEIADLRAALAARDARVRELEAMLKLLTQLDLDGRACYESAVEVWEAARALLAPPATPYGPNDAEFGMSEHRHRATPPATKEPT